MSARILTTAELRTLERIEAEMAWIRVMMDVKARQLAALSREIAAERVKAAE